MIIIELSFSRRSGHFTATASYFVGKSTRFASEYGTERAEAIARCLSRLRRRGHGGKPYKVLSDADGDGGLSGIVPKPVPRDY